MNFCHYVPSFVRSGPIHGNPSSHDSPPPPPTPPFPRRRKSERKNLIMISFRSNEALVLWGPARLPSSWVSGIGWGGGRAVRGAALQGVVCVACVANRLLLLLLLCCPAIGAAKNQQLDFVSLPFPHLLLLLLLLLLSRCCPIVIPACALCALSRYPRTGDCSPCAAVDNG